MRERFVFSPATQKVYIAHLLKFGYIISSISADIIYIVYSLWYK